MSGIEEPLVEVLATSPIPVTCPGHWTRDGLDPAIEFMFRSTRIIHLKVKTLRL